MDKTLEEMRELDDAADCIERNSILFELLVALSEYANPDLMLCGSTDDVVKHNARLAKSRNLIAMLNAQLLARDGSTSR